MRCQGKFISISGKCNLIKKSMMYWVYRNPIEFAVSTVKKQQMYRDFLEAQVSKNFID